MTNILFYLTHCTTFEEVLTPAIRVIEKSLRSGHQTVIAFEDNQQIETLKTALQALPNASFLPVLYLDDDQPIDEHEAIIITTGQTIPDKLNDVLISFCSHPPENFSRFNRLVEWVWQEDQALTTSRNRYKFYKNRGYPLNQHDLRKLTH